VIECRDELPWEHGPDWPWLLSAPFFLVAAVAWPKEAFFFFVGFFVALGIAAACIMLEAQTMTQHVYDVRPRKDKRGFNLVSDALPFGLLWYDSVENAVDYAKHNSRAHSAVIHVYNDAGQGNCDTSA
jgi:hypothetical protein